MSVDAKIIHVAQQYVADEISIVPLGNGLINDTFLLKNQIDTLVLQKINRQVFPNPALIMDNLQQLNRHVATKQTSLQIPSIKPTLTGASYYLDSQQHYWRALSYIENSESLETIRNIADAEQVGFALGCFHTLVSDLDPALLKDTLPRFHITPSYLKHYQNVTHQHPALPNNPTSQYCANFIDGFQSSVNDLELAKQQDLLPMRVIHGDPKLNNFLFDLASNKIIGLVDLDTVKPGLVHYDIGDCLRSSCHNIHTDEFDLTICDAILRRYLPEVAGFFSESDYQYLYSAIRLIPFELGLRFYTDYLEGNTYFKVTDPEQNCYRAAQQFRLCADIMAKEAKIISLISRLRESI
jgi:Ser/Thr protein kinase RdoA (MazF antagonist)